MQEKKEQRGEKRNSKKEKNSNFSVLLIFTALKKSVTQKKNPCILSAQEQFQSENLKEFKQKDIDLQYILMCIYS